MEITPKTIVKNIFQLTNVSNPLAMVYYTMLALWKNCPHETEPDVLRYLERAGKALLN